MFVTFLFAVMLTSAIVFAEGMETTGKTGVTHRTIGGFIGGVSPYLLMGLGILLILIQKLAKIVGILLLIIGVIRLLFMFV